MRSPLYHSRSDAPKEEIIIPDQQYVSDIITDASFFKKGYFNLIVAGCGTGKTTFCIQHLKDILHVKPYEILVATSRAIVANQMQSQSWNKAYRLVERNNAKEVEEDNDDTARIANFLNGKYKPNKEFKDALSKKGAIIVTYDMLARLLLSYRIPGKRCLSGIKVLVIDECHALMTDTFMKDMSVIKYAIGEFLLKGRLTVIGMTATDHIFREHNAKYWHYKLHDVLSEPLIRYRPKHTICTRFEYLHLLLKQKTFTGKTIILCRSIEQCIVLNKRLRNSTILVSRFHKPSKDALKKGTDIYYNPDVMDPIRNMIIDEECLPQAFCPCGPGTRSRPLRQLIATTTLREGFSLSLPKEAVRPTPNDVQNIVCIFPDDVNIIQFLGRCRYDIENLIIAPSVVDPKLYSDDDYFRPYTDEYDAYFKSAGKDGRWLEHFRDVFTSTELVDMSSDTQQKKYDAFINDIGCYISTAEDVPITKANWDTICTSAFRHRLLGHENSRAYKRKQVTQLLEDHGYSVTDEQRKIINGKRLTVRYIYPLLK